MSKADTKKRRIIIHKICDELGINKNEFAPNSFRLTKSCYPTIDVYPKSLRTFCHADQAWGDITDLEKFLKYQFS